MEESEILELLYRHSEGGLEQAQSKYNGLLVAICSAILKEPRDAEECVSDTYLKIWNIIPPFRPPHLRSFLCKIARQIAIDRYRKLHQKKHDVSKTVRIGELEDDFPDERLNDVETGDLNEAINEFLKKRLDIESKTLFVRRYFLMESQAELANRFAMTENAVNAKLFRVRNKLKKYLTERGYMH